jgi:hypothetical protein
MDKKVGISIGIFMLFVINCLCIVGEGNQQYDEPISAITHDDIKLPCNPPKNIGLEEYGDNKTIEGDLVIYKSNEIIDHLDISGYHVKGNIIVKLENCTSSTKQEILVNITGNWTEGDINFEHSGPGPIHLRIFSNPIVYGNISVHIHNVHTTDNESGVTVEIYDNGENIQDPSKNQAVGNIFVNLENNFCMPMEITVNHNWVHYIIQLNIKPGNQVNTCTLAVCENHVGDYIEVYFENNDVDRIFTVNILDNIIGERLDVFIRYNPHFGWKELACPCSIYTYITNNHCVEKNTNSQIWMSSNTHYGMPFYNLINENGFGGDINMFIVGNSNTLGAGDMVNKFENNKCDQQMTMTVQGNTGYQVKDYFIDNTASDAAPQIVPQHAMQQTGNIQQDPQTIGGDSDKDGLSDLYEKMIGTDQNNKDTDNDGFYDGWDDANGNKKWDAGTGLIFNTGEKFGEVGDPCQEVAVSKHLGSIATLFGGDDENPNPINKDIYIEIDFLEGCVFSPDVLKPVQTIFAKHCIHLHIDMGWDIGPAGGQTGGNIIDGGFVHNGRTYLYFSTNGTRRLLRPLPILKNDLYDLKLGITSLRPLGYFYGGRTGAREDIFHYVVVTHYYARKNPTGPGIEYRDGAYGVGELGRFSDCGDDFLICYDNHLTGGGLDAAELRDTFMHELGHNLGLAHSWEGGTPPAGYDPDPAVNPMGKETVFNTTMYWSGGNKLDYLRMEWARLDLPHVIDGTKIFYS